MKEGCPGSGLCIRLHYDDDPRNSVKHEGGWTGRKTGFKIRVDETVDDGRIPSRERPEVTGVTILLALYI